MLNITQPMLNCSDKYGYITGFMFSPCCNSDTRHSGLGQVVMKNCFLRFYSDDGSVDTKIRVPDYNTWSEPRQTEFDIWNQYLMNWYMRPVVFHNLEIGPFKATNDYYKFVTINMEFGYDSNGFWETAQNAYITVNLSDHLNSVLNITTGYYTGRKGYGRSGGFKFRIVTTEEKIPELSYENKNYQYWLTSNYKIVDGRKYLYRIYYILYKKCPVNNANFNPSNKEVSYA